jgi:hypothetical protein
MDDCDCCLLGCLCGACCAAAMDDDDRRRRDYHAQPVYVQPVVVTTATAYPMSAYPAQATGPNVATATAAPTGPYYYHVDPNNANNPPYPAYAAYPPQSAYPPPTKY